jgi:hypothetical protein
MPLVLAGVSGFADPAVAALTIFLMTALIGAKLFSGTSSHSVASRLGLLTGIAGAGTLGAIVAAASAGGLFGRVAGVLAVALATGAAVGGFLLTHSLTRNDAQPME